MDSLENAFQSKNKIIILENNYSKLLCYLENMKKLCNRSYLKQERRKHGAVYYTSPQSFIVSSSYSWHNNFGDLNQI